MRLKKLFFTFITLALLVAISQVPQGIRYGIKQWLMANGGEEVKLDDVDFNPLSATFALYGLAIERQGKDVLVIPELQVRLTWIPIFSKQILINRVMIKGVQIEIDRLNPEELLIGGIALPIASVDDNQIEDASLPWGIGIEKLEILDSVIQYRDEKLDVRFKIEELTITDLASYHPEQVVEIKLDGAINDAPITLNSQLTPFSDVPSLKNKIELQEFNLDLFNKLIAPDVSRLDGQLSVDMHLSVHYQPDATWIATQQGEVLLKQIDLRHDADHIKADYLEWNGGVQLQLSSQGQPQIIEIKGGITLANLASVLESQSSTVTLKKLEWQGKINHQPLAAGQKTEIDGELNFSHLHADSSELQAKLKQGRLSWRGKVQFEKYPADEYQQLQLQGEMKSLDLNLQLSQQEIELRYADLLWDGGLQFSKGSKEEEGNTIKLTGQLDIGQLQALAVNEKYLLLAIDQLKVKEIEAELPPVAINSKQIAVQKLAIGRSLEAEELGLLQVDDFKIADIHYSKQQGMSVSSIELQNLVHLTRRDSEGNWSEQKLLKIVQRFATSEEDNHSPALEIAQKEAPSKSLPIYVGNIQLFGESNLKFQDDLPDPPYQVSLDIHRFTLEGLNSATPNISSPMVLDATINQRSSLKLEGRVAPFASKLTLALQGQLEGFELPPLSSYSGSLLGYNLDSGELNADIVFDAKAGVLHGENKLKIHQLDVSPLSAEKMKGFDAQLNIPLDTALGMLRDSDNTISLTLPLSGSIDDIKVDPSDVINQAIGKALKEGATTYLTAALFPFGTMLAIAHIAGEEMAKIRLDPILFSAGAVNFHPKNQEYLGKIATILRERPEIHIKICGRAVQSDREALLQLAQQKLGNKRVEELAVKKENIDKKLKLLADNRAVAVESYLTKKEGIKPNRLISCRSITELDNKAMEPRVELLL